MPVDTSGNRRAPHREIVIKDAKHDNTQGAGTDEHFYSDDRVKSREAVVPESDIVQISQWTAHQDTIMSI